MKKRQEKQEDYALSLQERHERWAYLYEHGGSDPFWEDGCNLGLVRNHIHYYRGKIEETMLPENYPAIYYKKIPPEVDSKYMARPDEIRNNARASLAKYKADPNYQYMVQHYNDFTPKTRAKLCLDNVIGYATGLEHYIKEDKLVDMRRHERCNHYLQSFEDCVRKMQATPSEKVQLSMFSLFNDSLTESDENHDSEEYYDEEYEEYDEEQEFAFEKGEQENESDYCM